MRMTPVLFGAVAAGLLFGAGALVSAQNIPPAQAIKDRIANFKEIGSSFKAIRDELQGSSPNISTIQAAARRIESFGAKIPTWFPPGTGRDTQPANVPKKERSLARAEVWTRRAEFEQAHKKFLAEARKLNTVAQAGNAQAIGAQFKAVGEGWKNCHQTFKEKDH